MKYAIAAFITISCLSACTQNSQEGLYQTNEAQQTPRGTEYESNNMYRGYGYARHTNEEVQNSNDHAGALAVDRDMLAEGISRMVVDLPSVEEAAVLITDKYALAVYEQKNDDQPENLIADQVKRSVLAALPSFYETYVSNEPSHMADIERFQNLSAGEGDYKWLIEETIEELKEDPQGDVDLEEDRNMDIMKAKQKNLREGK